MGVSLSFHIPAMAPVIEGIENMPETLLRGWKQGADELGRIEQFNVARRTQERSFDTGALMSSVSYRTGDGEPLLVRISFASGPQYAQWNRYYAPYQEGPPAGLSTYTNPPRHLLYDATTEDVEQIKLWAAKWGYLAVQEELGIIQAGLPEPGATAP